ncbi:MAG: right-handed parallel beta-helix repeat-containing protein, partial [Planctomycetes bacterium]|nr:right-handed parallel beta-helix repeat-containing protein [Planctomycetota bacterium]
MRTVLGTLAILTLSLGTARAGTITVDVNDGGCVSGSGQPDPYSVVYCSIQDAIDDAIAADVISIAAGTYSAPLNIEGRSDLTIVGVDRDTVIIQPTSTLDWGSPYGSARQVAVRVYGSTAITLSTMTLDFSLVTGNDVYGVLYWDSTGTLTDNVFKNMSLSDAGGYYDEVTSCISAPGYTDAARAEVTVSDNEFVDTGRVAIITDEFVDATITGNIFYKTTDDFGYAIELSSQSIGKIVHNTIYGYDTAAASDDSPSIGIYIENSLTSGLTGITKSVSVISNEVYDCQYGLWIGNGLDGSAGDVDIDANVWGNYIHDNLETAVVVQDEDMANGSSVTAAFRNNVLVDNVDVGYLIYTNGDGDIDASLENETIIGHDVGVYLNDYAGGTSTSVYDIGITNSQIDGITGAVV